MFRSSLFTALCLISFTAGSLLPQIPFNAVESWNWKDCGHPTDALRIQNITISPDPPMPGKPLTVTVSGTAQEVIEPGATAVVTVEINHVRHLRKTYDLCDEARKANATVQCPVEKGDYVVVQTVDLPREIPRIKYDIHVAGYTVEEEDLVCMDLTVNFTPKRPF